MYKFITLFNKFIKILPIFFLRFCQIFELDILKNIEKQLFNLINILKINFFIKINSENICMQIIRFLVQFFNIKNIQFQKHYLKMRKSVQICFKDFLFFIIVFEC